MKTLTIFSIIMFLLLSVNIASAEIRSLPTQKQSSCVEIAQTCSNCTFVNVTQVKYPNSTFVNLNVRMQKTGFNYNYTFCNTTSIGTYIISTCGDVDGINTCVDYDVKINQTGDDITTAGSMIYLIGLLLGLVLFGVFTYLAYVMPVGNVRNQEGDLIVQINWKKNIKFFSMMMSYLTLMWLCWVAFNITGGYTSFLPAARFFEVVYRIMSALVIPIVFVGGLVAFVIFLRDLHLDKQMEKGRMIFSKIKL